MLEELCFLAAAGEVQEAEWDVVKAHLEECPSCRSAFSDLGAIHSSCFPQIVGFEVERLPGIEGRLRDSILHAASREGAKFSQNVTPHIRYKPRWETAGTFQTMKVWGIGASLLVVSGCVGLSFALRQSKRAATAVPMAGSHFVVPSLSQGLSSPQIERRRRNEEILEQEVAALKAERSQIEKDLQREEADNRNLQNLTAEMKEQIGSVTTELQTTRSLQAKAEEALKQLKAERENDQSAIQAQNHEIRSLNERLREQSSQKQLDQDVLDAEARLRELVGARNLHIVDVYDTDSSGKTNKAVGRVFYTQGQSLVFYAYDLSTNNRFDTGKYAYYVWGHKDGNDESVRNLGTLDPDDASKGRWMLKVNDGKALSNIDRVFVTLEQNSKLDLRPHGKKILSAYLGSPVNHP